MTDGKPSTPDVYLLGRLESFSDLVFGFVVPMMAVNLKVPNSPAELIHSRKEVLVFAASFLLLCTLWLRHHRMMRRYFVSNPVGIFLVFVILGTVALYSYPLQLYFRFPGDPLALRAYAWGFAFLCLLYLLMALYAYLRYRTLWEPKETYEARRAIAANAVVGAAMLSYPLAYSLGAAAMAVPVGVVVAFRFARPWIGRGLPTVEPSKGLEGDAGRIAEE